MSQLTPFVRAFRAVAEASRAQAKAASDKADELAPKPSALAELKNAMLLDRLALTFFAAATDLEQQIAQDLTRTGPRP